MGESKPEWWRGGLIYQIYPRSFCDANGDGIGDIVGITSKLPYVSSLGVDAVWLSPVFTSPMKDFGYDISDYRGIDPIFGTLDEFENLVTSAHKLGLKVMIDQVLSHTSDQHKWFEQSRQDKINPKSDWYVWADAKPDGSPPNNWLSVFGGSAWTWEPRRLQYYLHNFLASQPDLNFHNSNVREAQLENLRFWFELGIDGVRLDVVNYFFHSAGLEDNPPASREGQKSNGMPLENPYAYQQHIYDISRPDNLPFLRALRAVMDEYPGSTSVGEIAAEDSIAVMSEYTSGNDRLHMAYTFDLLNKRSDADYIRAVLDKVETNIGDGWPCYALSNHDVIRHVTRWGEGCDRLAFSKVALAMLMSLRGSVCLYQGDELGLTESDVPYDKIQDPYGLPFWPAFKGRDGCRTPMVWRDTENGDFSECGEPWLPVEPAHLSMAVSRQINDDQSTLSFARSFIEWRKQHRALISGDFELFPDTGDILCWSRKDTNTEILVAFNLTSEAQRCRSPRAIRRVLNDHGLSGSFENGDIVLPSCGGFYALV